MNKNHFFTYYHKFYIKDKTSKNHWVGHSLMKPIDVDKLSNRRVINSELEASFIGDDAIDASVITGVQI